MLKIFLFSFVASICTVSFGHLLHQILFKNDIYPLKKNTGYVIKRDQFEKLKRNHKIKTEKQKTNTLQTVTQDTNAYNM